MSQDWRAERLPCGEELSDLVEQVVEGRGGELTAHQRRCQWCPVALEDVARLWRPLIDYRDAELEVPERVVDAIVARVRNLTSLGWITLQRTSRGLTRVSGWLVAAIAELAADATPRVRRVGTSKGRVADTLLAAQPTGARERSATGGRAFEAGDHQAAVDLDVVTEYGASIAEVSERIRDNVRAEVRARTGLEAVEVNVAVIDVEGGA